MEITKDTIKELFTTMHLIKVTIGQTLRRSERLARSREQLQLKLDAPIYKINNEEPIQLPITLHTPLPISEDLFKTPVKRPPPIDYSFTTQSRALYNFISPDKQDDYLKLLKQDDAIIERMNIDIKDTPFNQIDGSEMGVYIESWICSNFFCPGCEQYTLYKYSHPNMPVVDVACVNPEHILSHGPRYYQIKATGNRSGGMPYFTRRPILYSPTGYIKVGSKRYGKFSHEVLVTDSNEDKELVVGYICISYTDNGNMKITINPDESFILIPNLISLIKSEARHNAYYKYLYTRNSVVVSYNHFYVMAFSLREYFKLIELNLDLLNNISINYRFDYNGETTINQILNPTQETDSHVASMLPIQPTPLRTEPVNKKPHYFYNKYLMYKSKYIHLKLSNLKLD